MSHHRRLTAVLLVSLILSPFVGPPDAHAAISGTIAGGPGVGSGGCGSTAQCLSWTRLCGTPQTNDLDASVRPAGGYLDRQMSFSWSAAAGQDGNAMVIETYSGNCSRIQGPIVLTARSGAVSLSGGAMWIVVMPKFPFAQFTWSLA